ncbi:serine protease [Streptomyces diastatochromogenes]|uniref:Uncharacterized protein n=1 Tax=Streptomyces diastatochromogenes TaxID=42236 RepID=A0A233SH51_STRDA|nr:serine protease [Streptomyces diastatochromogenes]MCZ0985586.1 serine protease [Streptomyces diastatochromogenes]OXY94986.1 hypothetical protein BEK98_17900 [Streptomyces diastatochromogenes]
MPFDSASVVEVLNDDAPHRLSYGTGYQVATGLVLTALHIVTRGIRHQVPASVKVRRMTDGADWIVAEPVWHDDTLDAVLLAIDDGVSVPPVRFGTLTAPDPQHPVKCGVVGFPRVQAGPSGRNPMSVDGVLHGITQRYADRYQVELRPLEHRNGWQGMSGSAVFCGPLLTGMIVTVPQGLHADRANAVPAHALLECPSFRAVLGRGEYPEPELESVELCPLLVAPPNRAEYGSTDPHSLGASVAHLLHPRVRTAEFIGREDELERLMAWALSPVPMDVMVVTGPMGVGKTRLAVELGRRLGSDWVTGFLRTEPPEAPPASILHPITTSEHPLLLVIDYAETREDWQRSVLETLAGYRKQVPVRVLFLCRPASASESVRRTCWKNFVDFGPHSTLRLENLGPDDQEGPDPTPLGATAHTFAERLYGADLLFDLFALSLQELRTEASVTHPFTLNLMACAEAITRFEGTGDRGSAGTSPYEVVLSREERYWLRTARWYAPSIMNAETLDLLRTLVVTQGLFGGRNRNEAAAAVRAGWRTHYGLAEGGLIPDGPDVPEARLLRNLLKALYPSGEAEWGGLGPHALLAHLLASAERRDPGLLEALLRAPELDVDQRRRGLETLLLAAGSDRPDLTATALDTVAGAPDELGQVAIDVAHAATEPEVWLRRVRATLPDPDGLEWPNDPGEGPEGPGGLPGPGGPELPGDSGPGRLGGSRTTPDLDLADDPFNSASGFGASEDLRDPQPTEALPDPVDPFELSRRSGPVDNRRPSRTPGQGLGRPGGFRS